MKNNKDGRDEKLLKVGEMKNTERGETWNILKGGRDEKYLKVGEMKNT